MLGKNMKGGAAKKFEKSIGQKLHKTWVSFKCKLIAFSCKSTLYQIIFCYQCYSHKLELCIKAANKEAPGHKEYDAMINIIHKYYGPANHKVSLFGNHVPNYIAMYLGT